jgi:hypothetical protein
VVWALRVGHNGEGGVEMRKRMLSTPWGVAQDVQKEAEGITWYSTASHGGYGLSAYRASRMPEEYRRHEPFAGRHWYEEDCDWCLVWLSFPEEMRAFHSEDPERFERTMSAAHQTYEAYFAKR